MRLEKGPSARHALRPAWAAPCSQDVVGAGLGWEQAPRPVAAPLTRHTGAASRGSSTSEQPGGAIVWTWGFLGIKVPHLSRHGSQPRGRRKACLASPSPS